MKHFFEGNLGQIIGAFSGIILVLSFMGCYYLYTFSSFEANVVLCNVCTIGVLFSFSTIISLCLIYSILFAIYMWIYSENISLNLFVSFIIMLTLYFPVYYLISLFSILYGFTLSLECLFILKFWEISTITFSGIAVIALLIGLIVQFYKERKEHA